MITDAIIWFITGVLNILFGWIPTPEACNLSGLSSATSFLGQVIGTTRDFIPWPDLFIMLGIILVIGGVKLIILIIHLIKP